MEALVVSADTLYRSMRLTYLLVMHMARLTLLGTFLVFLPLGLGAAEDPKPPNSRTIDPEQSSIIIHVFRAGLFSAFGHDHEIRAPIVQGSFTEGENPAVEFSVDARKMSVEDKEVSPKDRAEIQSTMLGPKVLDTERYPEIKFRSSTVESAGAGKWQVRGDLTLHGQRLPITVDVGGAKGRYRGSAVLRQKDFGITPVTVAGGAVKVKNEVKVEFQILGE